MDGVQEVVEQRADVLGWEVEGEYSEEVRHDGSGRRGRRTQCV